MECAIKDKEFIRGDVPMTKEEIRVLTLCKLQLKHDSVFLDIGAGTGTISITASKIITKGNVVLIEEKKEALEIIKQNIDKFHCNNIIIIHGSAPAALPGNLPFTHAFVGGSSGELEKILKYIDQNIEPGGIVVVNAISHVTLHTAFNYFQVNNFLDIESICVNISRSQIVKKSVLYRALNPVYIISARKRDV